MPANDYSVGRDSTISIITPQGPLNLGEVIGFSPKQETNSESFTKLDGITDHILHPKGWSGTFALKRTTGDVDAFFDLQENNYFLGVNQGKSVINQFIKEINGSITQFRFERCSIRFDDPGSWMGDKSVDMVVFFLASRRIKVS